MPKPDVQMSHEEAGRIYFNGRIYEVILNATGWSLSRPHEFLAPLYEGETVEDCCVWLTAQKATA